MDKKFFLGSNTVCGFDGKFSDMLDYADAVILKGGAGSGKSTLMKKIGKEAAKHSLNVEYYYCSGDIASLDGVYIPDKNIAVLDGTAPHAIEPKIPVLKHRIINLLDKADRSKISSETASIEKLIICKNNHFNRAYEYLKSLKHILNVFDSDSLHSLRQEQIAEIIDNILPMVSDKKQQFSRSFYISAITADGIVNFVEDSLLDYKNILIDCDYSTMSLHILPKLEASLRRLNVNYTKYLSPFYVGCAEAISIADVLVSSYEKIPAVKAFSLRAKPTSGVNRAFYDNLIEAASEELQRARAAHFEIERCYHDAMNWGDVNQKTDALLKDIFGNC